MESFRKTRNDATNATPERESDVLDGVDEVDAFEKTSICLLVVQIAKE